MSQEALAVCIGKADAATLARYHAMIMTREQSEIPSEPDAPSPNPGGFDQTGQRFLELQQFSEGVFEIAQAIVMILDRSGRIVLINPFTTQLTGYTNAEVQGKSWFDTFLRKEDRPKVGERFDDAITGDRTRGYTNPIVTRDGGLRHISWWDHPLADDTGHVLGLLCIGHDVTERVGMLDALSASEARYRTIHDHAVDAIITINEHGTIESVNTAALSMFGYSTEELIGKSVSILMPEPYRSQHNRYMQGYLVTGARKIIGIGREAEGLRRDGSTFPISLAVSEMFYGGGRHFAGTVRDISEQKRLEKEVAQISAAEQQRIGRDLHDGLGQELTGIAFLAGSLRSRLGKQKLPEADNAAEILELVNRAIEHTRAVVRGLCPVRMDAEGLMASLIQFADSTKQVHDIDCEFECEPPVLVHDPSVASHLFFIAQEAVTNAIRHGHATRIRITLVDEGDKCVLTVEDNGIGLKASAGDGNGRGMQIMNYRAHLIKGELSVDSGSEGGTRLRCRFDPQINEPKAGD